MLPGSRWQSCPFRASAGTLPGRYLRPRRASRACGTRGQTGARAAIQMPWLRFQSGSLEHSPVRRRAAHARVTGFRTSPASNLVEVWHGLCHSKAGAPTNLTNSEAIASHRPRDSVASSETSMEDTATIAVANLSRYDALLRTSKTLAAHRTMTELFEVLAENLHPIVPFDYLALLLHDESTDEMRLV